MTFTINMTNEEIANVCDIIAAAVPEAEGTFKNGFSENDTVIDMSAIRIASTNNSFEVLIDESFSNYLLTGPIKDLAGMTPILRKIFGNFLEGCENYIKPPITTTYDAEGNVLECIDTAEEIKAIEKEMEEINKKLNQEI